MECKYLGVMGGIKYKLSIVCYKIKQNKGDREEPVGARERCGFIYDGQRQSL